MPDLTVMTWNIQNLFPVGHADGPTTQQEYDDKSLASPRSSTPSSQTCLPFRRSPRTGARRPERGVQHRF